MAEIITGSLSFNDATEAGLEINSYTTAERNSLSSPQQGQEIFNIDEGRIEIYDGAQWVGVANTSDLPVQNQIELFSASGATSTTGGLTTPVVLATIPIAANLFAADGYSLKVDMYFSGDAPSSLKEYSIEVDGTVAWSFSQNTANLNSGLAFTAVRSSATSLKCFTYREGQNQRQFTLVGGLDLTTAFDIEIIGTSAAGPNINLEFYFATLGRI